MESSLIHRGDSLPKTILYTKGLNGNAVIPCVCNEMLFYANQKGNGYMRSACLFLSKIPNIYTCSLKKKLLINFTTNFIKKWQVTH